MSPTVSEVLLRIGLTIGILMTSVPFLVWAERRLLAALQDRYGPNRVGPFGLLQTFADAIKLLTKEDWIPPFADRLVYVVAPAIVVVTVLLAFAVVPFGPGGAIVDLNVGVLFFLAMSSLSVYSVVLAGLASNSKYALLASVRGSAQMISYELAMGLSIAAVVVVTGSLDLSEIVAAQAGRPFALTQPVAFFVFMLAGFAEAKRTPFDIPEAENELVAGFHTEYASLKFALFFLGEYMAITLFSSIAVAAFLGGSSGPWGASAVWFALKVAALIYVFIWVRGTLPRMRYDHLMSFGWKFLVPLALLNLVVTGAIVVARSAPGG